MNPETNKNVQNDGGPAALGFVIVCFLFVGLVLALKYFTRPPAIDADRAAVRTQALAEIHTAEAVAIAEPGWVDQARGVVRLPLSLALQITARDWQNPAAARSNLISRVEKATTPLPKPVEKPSQFE